MIIVKFENGRSAEYIGGGLSWQCRGLYIHILSHTGETLDSFDIETISDIEEV